jgi:phosphomannomutase/phosphoglucomutase
MSLVYPFFEAQLQPFPEAILKPCDIRGLTPNPLGPEQAYQVGLAVGTHVQNESSKNLTAVVGFDIRESSPALVHRLMEGLKETGMKVVDAGAVSTPLLAFATRHSGAAIGVMVTASHNPPAYNGFKFFHTDGSASIAWLYVLYEILRNGTFRNGVGSINPWDFLDEYKDTLVKTIQKSFRGLKLVVDLGNGASVLTAPKVLEALGCETEWMNEKIDPLFSGRGADSSHLPALEPLGRRVRETGSLMGAAFDGDGDRITFVDDMGFPLPNDDALCLLAGHYLKASPGGIVVYDAKSAGHVDETIRKAGGIPILERTGHVFIHNRMQKEGALLAGEASGHFFLPGMFPGDALYTLLVFAAMLKDQDQPLSTIRKKFPLRVTSNDLKVRFEMDALPSLTGSLAKRARDLGADVSEVDGVRAVFKDGWGIVRASVTEPVLSCRFEAGNRAVIRQMVETWFDGVPALRDELMGRLSKG